MYKWQPIVRYNPEASSKRKYSMSDSEHEMTERLPCPICGDVPEIKPPNEGGYPGFSIICNHMHTGGKSDGMSVLMALEKQTATEACIAWNSLVGAVRREIDCRNQQRTFQLTYTDAIRWAQKGFKIHRNEWECGYITVEGGDIICYEDDRRTDHNGIPAESVLAEDWEIIIEDWKSVKPSQELVPCAYCGNAPIALYSESVQCYAAQCAGTSEHPHEGLATGETKTEEEMIRSWNLFMTLFKEAMNEDEDEEV